MRDLNGGGRIRVLIAGDVYTKRALVKRFLEDDGFSVVTEARTRTELRAALDTADPDAVVVDARFLTGYDSGLEMIRRKAPGSQIVVFTTGPQERPTGADGYLERGVGLATLTALLGRLFSDPVVVLGSTGLVGAEEASAPGILAGTTTGGMRPAGTHRREPHAALRAGALGIAALIVVTLTAALLSSNRNSTTTIPKEDPTATRSPYTSQSTLELALSDLLQLRDALLSDSYLEARVYAQSLMNDRSAALEEGFSISALDLRIGSLLSPVMESIAPRMISFLLGTLGDLLPPVPFEGGGGAGGSTITGDGGSSTGGSTDGGVTSGGGGSGSGSGSGGGETGGGGGGTGGGGTGGGGDGFPGQGKHLGWSHKPPHGGWHGHKPK